VLIYSSNKIVCYTDIQSWSRIGHDIYSKGILHHLQLYQKDSGQAGVTNYVIILMYFSVTSIHCILFSISAWIGFSPYGLPCSIAVRTVPPPVKK
jgi:hypothetical protein